MSWLLSYWKKKGDGKGGQGNQQDIHYRPEELAREILKALAKVTAQTQSVTIATRKGTWQRIAGQKGEAKKGRDQKARKDQIGQDVHIKLEKIL